MAITSAIATSFKVEILKGVHNFTNSSGNTFKIALIKANASQTGTYGAATESCMRLGRCLYLKQHRLSDSTAPVSDSA